VDEIDVKCELVNEIDFLVRLIALVHGTGLLQVLESPRKSFIFFRFSRLGKSLKTDKTDMVLESL